MGRIGKLILQIVSVYVTVLNIAEPVGTQGDFGRRVDLHIHNMR